MLKLAEDIKEILTSILLSSKSVLLKKWKLLEVIKRCSKPFSTILFFRKNTILIGMTPYYRQPCISRFYDVTKCRFWKFFPDWGTWSMTFLRDHFVADLFVTAYFFAATFRRRPFWRQFGSLWQFSCLYVLFFCFFHLAYIGLYTKLVAVNSLPNLKTWLLLLVPVDIGSKHQQTWSKAPFTRATFSYENRHFAFFFLYCSCFFLDWRKKKAKMPNLEGKSRPCECSFTLMQ